MPCSDAITCQEEIVRTSSSTLNHDHSEDEDDVCSPFCVCSCCGSYTFLFTPYNIFHIEKIAKANTPIFVSFYHSDFISSYYYSFWQPPKISLS